jgi:hypothetical protein
MMILSYPIGLMNPLANKALPAWKDLARELFFSHLTDGDLLRNDIKD